MLSAAGWKTDTAIKEFGGQTRRLAKKAADAGYDLLIGFGGDGTLNQLVNGVMAAKRDGCTVGVLPGGTANVWAHEIGIPEDPIKASLRLVNSEGRKVDVGHVAVDFLPFAPARNDQHVEKGQAPQGRHHFLLMAGLGMDAAIMRRVPTSLKERIGKAAVALATLRTLPSQHAFPVEIWSPDATGNETLRWRGEAFQVIVGNTRRYGNFAEVTPKAIIDDGALDVCVITAGGILSTIDQILSILLQHNPRDARIKRFRDSHFCIRAPASIDLQLDGSRMKTRDSTKGSEAVMATYRFDAIPRALCMAIPCTYTGSLFEHGSAKSLADKREERQTAAVEAPTAKDLQDAEAKEHHALLAHGRKVTVVGVAPNPEREATYIVAGDSAEKKASATKPIAVRIDHKTTLVGPRGEPLPTTFASKLTESTVIVVEGKQNKRGVVKAKRVAVAP